MKNSTKRFALCLLGFGVLTLFGCGGGGSTLTPSPSEVPGASTTTTTTPSPSEVPGASTTTTSTTTMTVTPSLGKFSAGTVVKLNKIDETLLSSGTIDATGTATLSLVNYTTGPILVTVVGAAGVTYFDEGTNAQVAFGPNAALQALLPTSQNSVGVTALTNAATAMLAAETGGISAATAATINTANYKMAVAFGLPDILQSPNPVGAAASADADKLDLAKPADRYALVLAAFAKTSTAGNPAQKSLALALDMKDGILDGKDGKSTTPSAMLANAATPAAMVAAYQTAARAYANAASQVIAANTPMVMTANVTAVQVMAYQSEISQAKALFAELRTTLSSFSNGSTGFLDTEAVRMQADVDASVAPSTSLVQDRIMAFSDAAKAFDAATRYTTNTQNGFTGVDLFPITGSPALYRETGSIPAAIGGYGTYSICWTPTKAAPSSTGGTITCAYAGASSTFGLAAPAVSNSGSNSTLPPLRMLAAPAVSISGSNSTLPPLRMMVYTLTGNGSGQYSYTATRYNRVVNNDYTLGAITIPDLPTGSGTLSTSENEVSFSGTFPPSAYSPSTGLPTAGIDTLTIAATRTAMSAANTYYYALSGSVSTSQLSDATKPVSLSLDSGSYIATDETDRAATGTIKPLGVKFVGTAKTAATKANGSFELKTFVADKSGTLSPTSLTFEGSLSDIRSTVAEADRLVLAGKIAATVTGLENYDPRLPKSNANYFRPSLTFTGTVQGPARPLLKLVLTVAETGSSPTVNFIGTVGLDYSYGTVRITGSGVANADSNTSAMTLSNQDGIAIATRTGLVTKSGNTLATIANDMVNYADGTSESLK